MHTIILSSAMPESCGGRPKKPGGIEYTDDGQIGVFLGYDHEHKTKVLIPVRMIDTLLEPQQTTMVIKASIRPQRMKNLGYRLFKQFVPEKFKEKMIEEQGRLGI